MKKLLHICFIFYLAIYATEGTAQTSRPRSKSKTTKQHIFKFGIIASPLLSQLDGDSHQGFDKPGYFAGVKGEARLTNLISLEVDLAYSVLGSKFPLKNPFAGIKGDKRKITITFAEVPFIFNYRMPKEGYDLMIEAGIGYNQIVDYQVIEGIVGAKDKSYSSISADLNKRGINGLGGIELLIKNFSIGFRATSSFTYQYYNEKYFELAGQNKFDTTLVPLLRSYYVGFTFGYTLLAIGQ